MKKSLLGTLVILFLATSFVFGQQPKIELVKNLRPSTGAGFYQVSNEANGIKVINNKAFFHGSENSTIGGELYITDGTDTGTVLVKDIDSRTGRNSLYNFNYDYSSIVFNSEIYFSADTGQGKELWKSDGTTGGTVMVKDIMPGTSSGSEPNNFAVFNNRMFFDADTSGSVNRLYYTDGTTANTEVFSNAISRAETPFIFNGKLYYKIVRVGGGRPYAMAAIDSSWNIAEYTGGAASNESFKSPYPSTFAVADSFAIYSEETFAYGREFYVIDMNGNQSLLKNIGSGSNNGVLTNIRRDNIAAAGNVIYFQGRSATAPPYQTELWKTDGTTGGTVKVKDIGNPTKNTGNIEQMVAMDGKVYFAATNDTAGYELWVSDGTTAGTKMVKSNAIPGNNNWGKGPQNLYVHNDLIYYSAKHSNGTSGKIELWVSDGTSTGTMMVAELDTGTPYSASPDNFFTLNNKLYFSAYGPTTGYEIYTLTEFFNVSMGADTTGCDSVELGIDVAADSYLWSTGDTTSTIFASTSGTYWIQAIDSKGKVGRDTIVVTIYDSPSPSITGDLTACGSTTISADQNYLSYVWSSGHTTMSFSTDTSINFLQLTVTSAGGCSGSDFQYVVIDTLPEFSLGADTADCAYFNFNVDLDYFVTWNDGDTSHSKQVTQSGTYSAIISDGNSCEATDSIDVIIDSYPSIPFTQDTTSCDSLVLTITQSYSSLQWEDGDTSASHTYSSSGETSASIVLTDDNNCTSSSYFYVRVEKTPVFQLRDTSICGVDSIYLQTSGALPSYLWSNAMTTANIWVKNSEDIWLKASTPFGCSFTDTAHISIGDNPVINLADTMEGCDSVMVDAGSYDKYLWWDNSTESSYTFYENGTNWVKVFNVEGCFATDTFEVVVNHKPNSDFNDFHSTNITQFIPSHIGNIDGFAWKFGDEGISTDSQPYHTFEYKKEYTVRFIASNGCGMDTTIKGIISPYGKTRSVGNLKNSTYLQAYPNPAMDYLNIDLLETGKTVSLKIVSAIGEVVYSQDVIDHVRLDVSSYSPGSYMIIVVDKDNMGIVRFVKY